MDYAHIISLLLTYKYLILLPIMIVEGPIITVIAGFLAFGGYLDFWFVFLFAVLGDILGDLIYYFIGRLGGNAIVKRGKFLGIKSEYILKMEKHFELHPIKTLLFGKLTHAVGWVILVASGMAKMSLNKFTLVNAVATIPKVFIFAVIGYYFGSAYKTIDHYFNMGGIFIGIVLVIGIIVYVFWNKRSKKIDENIV